MIPMSKPQYDEKEFKALSDVVLSGWWTMGAITEKLEIGFAAFCGRDWGIGVSSCSAALHLSLIMATRIFGKGKIITSPLTFCSTVNAIIHSGNIPVLADVNNSQCIDPIEVLEIIVNDNDSYIPFAGILPIHFAGAPCDMGELISIAGRHDLFIVNDCAHAIETTLGQKRIGSFGLASCYSFNPVKNIAAPEMGMVVTDSEELRDGVRRLRLHGMDIDAKSRVNKPGQYDICDLGYKYNCTDIEAAFALEQFNKLISNWKIRAAIVTEYINVFSEFESSGLFKGHCPIDTSDPEKIHGLHLMTIWMNNRDKFILKMREEGVYCGIHYKPVHLHSYYKKYGWELGDFPVAEWIGEHTVSLPLGPGMTKGDFDKVVSSMEKVFKGGDYSLIKVPGKSKIGI